MGSLTTILKRLEAATSRLEDLAVSQAGSVPAAGVGGGAGGPASAVSATTIGQPSPTSAVDNIRSADQSPAVKDFDALRQNALKQYVTLSNQLGGITAKQAAAVEQAFNAQADFVEMASQCKPVSTSSPQFASLIKPTQEPLAQVIELKEKNRGNKDEINFLFTVAEGIPALGWVTLDSTPGPFVGEMRDAAQFYANRVVKDHKGKNETAVQWTKAFIALLEDLRKYIMAHHTTGLAWNPKGIDAAQYSGSGNSAAGAPAPPPPPPPPAAPPAPAPMDVDSPKAAPSAGDMTSVFASINQGENITSGLRKVKPSEMTHKNPELRAAAAAPAASSSGSTPSKAPKPSSLKSATTTTAKPPKKVLEGNKWTIENFENDQNIAVEQTELNQIVNIYNVKNSTVVIRGKVNAVSVVNCRKLSLLVDSLVSSLAISTSPSFTVQIVGSVPTLQVDGTDGGQVYLSKDSLSIEIITAKSSALNVSLPVQGEEQGVFEEKPVPEQIKTVVQNGKLVSSIVEHTAA